MTSNFDKAMKFVLDHEKGYSNNPNDPGGETKWGISKKAYPKLDIKNLTEEQAKEIYKSDYWVPMGCDAIDSPLDICAFDSAVNHGKSRARSFLNQCNGDYNRFLNIRMRFYVRIIKQRDYLREFLLGWMRRLNDLSDICDNEVNKIISW